MLQIARILILTGIFLVIGGILIYLWGKFLPLGRLPGDIVVKRGNFVFYFPLMTCLIISGVLSLIFVIISKITR